jgi:23S rRNA (uracil1939-C5)-methyltransferase
VRLTVTLDELAPGGDAVAIAEIAGERRAIFVRGGSPGDRAVVDVDVAKRPARGRIVTVEAAGPERVTPPCRHTESCGGCDWLHIAPSSQAAHHADIVRRALPEGWRTHPITSHAAGRALGYRTRARLHARVSGGRAIVGMNEAQGSDPVEVDTCVVLDPALDHARALLGPLLEGAHGRGDAQIALGPLGAPRKPVLELRWAGPLAPAVYGRIEKAVLSGAWAGARIFADGIPRPATIGDPTPWMRGADGQPLRLPAGGFAQAAEEENVRLAARVAALAKESGAKKILELFAGAGNLTVLFAAQGSAVVGVESDRAACEAARANLLARGLKGKIVEADAEEHAIAPGTDLVVLDPPRTGARKASATIAASKVKHVLYVSCDPQTLGRDLALLEPRFGVKAIETFEMFPGTSHVETVVLLARRRP